MNKISPDLINKLLTDYKKPEDVIGETGLLKQLTKALRETALDSEPTEHLGYGKNAWASRNTGNSRNGKTQKTLKTDQRNREIEVPRDRISEFEP